MATFKYTKENAEKNLQYWIRLIDDTRSEENGFHLNNMGAMRLQAQLENVLTLIRTEEGKE